MTGIENPNRYKPSAIQERGLVWRISFWTTIGVAILLLVHCIKFQKQKVYGRKYRFT